jgi:hypothetical protein
MGTRREGTNQMSELSNQMGAALADAERFQWIGANKPLIEFSKYICKVVSSSGKYTIEYHHKPDSGEAIVHESPLAALRVAIDKVSHD